MEKQLHEWWISNGSQGQEASWILYCNQNKPIPGILRKNFREYIKGFKDNNYKTKVNFKDINNNAEFIKEIISGKKISELANIFNSSVTIIENKLESLRANGYIIQESNGVYKLEKNTIIKENKIKENWDYKQTIIKFGIVSDTHLCSKYQQLTHLNNFYDVCQSEGINKIYHAMDISEGYNKKRPGHVYDLIPGCIGADEQSDYIIKNYPHREGIKTYFGTGNHDHWHIINGGVDIGRKIANERKDMVYMGLSNYKVELTPNCIMEVNHPLDGSAYALSYSIQKYMDSIMGGDKPNILINGHHHKAMYLFYRNIHALEAGCFEAQTPWMRGKRISANVGGFIITVYVEEDGTIKRFVPEFIPYYKMISEDY